MNKILVIGMSDTLGGVETYIYNLIKGIYTSDYYFDFLIIGQQGKSVFEEEISHVFNDHKEHFFYCPNLKKNFFETRKWLKQFFDANIYDVIYLNTCTSARIVYCLYGLKSSETKLITHSHNGQADRIIGRVTNFLFKRFTTRRSDIKLACSDVAYEYLFSGKPEENWFVPNGVDINRYKFSDENRVEIRSKLNLSDNRIVIGCVGRFTAQKNHQYLIDIAKRLPENYSFLIIGNGDLKESFVDSIKRGNLSSKFQVLDAQSDIEKYYSAMDLFVMPSIFEGLPITAIEAQCNGLPCVFSTNISRQVKLSENCRFLDLESKDRWIETIVNKASSRYDGVSVIKERKFGSEDTNSFINEMLHDLIRRKNSKDGR